MPEETQKEVPKEIYLAFVSPQILLGFMLFMIFPEGPWTITGMITPFFDQSSQLLAIGATLLAIGNIFIVNHFINQAQNNPQQKILALVTPETSTILGFIVAFTSGSPMVFLPFLVMGLGLFAYTYLSVIASS